MNDLNAPVFCEDSDRLSLVTDQGKTFLGLEDSSSPEIAGRVRSLFEHLNGKLGFPDTPEGKRHQECFNQMLRSVYPEIMIDLADMIYVQHERPAVYLNFDHININLKKYLERSAKELQTINKQMGHVFSNFGRMLKNSPEWVNDPDVVRLLAESYSYYLFQTRNFPWEDPLQGIPGNPTGPLCDVATGLTGFSMIHDWPESSSNLALTDNMPFIVIGLTHFKNLCGRRNIEVLEADFPEGAPAERRFGFVSANKFLHHLKRSERVQFLQWALGSLETGGKLGILDSDLEHQLLWQAKEPNFKNRLIEGFPETLVEIEKDFCETLVSDVRSAGFKVLHFDFHEYMDETDAYSQLPGDNISFKFFGFEILAERRE